MTDTRWLWWRLIAHWPTIVDVHSYRLGTRSPVGSATTNASFMSWTRWQRR